MTAVAVAVAVAVAMWAPRSVVQAPAAGRSGMSTASTHPANAPRRALPDTVAGSAGAVQIVTVAVIVGVDAHGRRAVLGLDIGPSQAEAFSIYFLGTIARRGLPCAPSWPRQLRRSEQRPPGLYWRRAALEAIADIERGAVLGPQGRDIDDRRPWHQRVAHRRTNRAAAAS